VLEDVPSDNRVMQFRVLLAGTRTSAYGANATSIEVSNHAKLITDTGAGGKTKRVSSSGTSDTKNDIMLYSFVEAEPHEAAAKSFESHPHLQIPQ
jgi:hypothetical protein